MSNHTKTCPSCKHEKPYSAFYKSSKNKDGYQYDCKKCMREKYETNESKEGFYDPNESRKFYAISAIARPNHKGLTKEDVIRFIPRSKTVRI